MVDFNTMVNLFSFGGVFWKTFAVMSVFFSLDLSRALCRGVVQELGRPRVRDGRSSNRTRDSSPEIGAPRRKECHILWVVGCDSENYWELLVVVPTNPPGSSAMYALSGDKIKLYVSPLSIV